MSHSCRIKNAQVFGLFSARNEERITQLSRKTSVSLLNPGLDFKGTFINNIDSEKSKLDTILRSFNLASPHSHIKFVSSLYPHDFLIH